MSEPSLSDREQAILAGLAAQAEADDPRLAQALRRGPRLLLARLPVLPSPLAHWTVGLLAAVVGLAACVVLLGVSVVAALAASVLLFAGVGRVVAAGPWRRRSVSPPTPDSTQPSAG
ncbi:DUF3040 domain-containing protein [Acidimicrobiaceae bacterium USS-CC1]|uniref:DUF3040 domain-containing protein n=1 Tax=Acidiferrimicrobium australe TaxID=2664430 RepID=A0ABW9QX30_9ACTN|nr:DUF3040 domain-containing protein [Acidiferrimicrobium australe]